jgi:hypothetical protein
MESIVVQSDPPGATVTVSNGEVHVTPFTISVPREQSLAFHFEKAGFQSVDITDPPQAQSEFMALESIPLPGVSLLRSIDANAGAGLTHQSTSLRVHLDAETPAQPSSSATPTSTK